MINILHPISRHLNQGSLILRCGGDIPPPGDNPPGPDLGTPIGDKGNTDTFVLGFGAYLWENGVVPDGLPQNKEMLFAEDATRPVTKIYNYRGDDEGIYFNFELHTTTSPYSHGYYVTIGSTPVLIPDLHKMGIGDSVQLADESGIVWSNTKQRSDSSFFRDKYDIEVFVPDAIVSEGDFNFSIQTDRYWLPQWAIDNVFVSNATTIQQDRFMALPNEANAYNSIMVAADVDFVPASEDLAGTWNETLSTIASLSDSLDSVGEVINKSESLDLLTNNELGRMADHTTDAFNTWSDLEDWSTALLKSLQGQYVREEDFIDSMISAAMAWGIFNSGVASNPQSVFSGLLLFAKDTMDNVVDQNDFPYPSGIQFSAIDTFEFVHEELKDRGMASQARSMESAVKVALDEFGDLAANVQATKLLSELYERFLSYNDVKFFDYDQFEDLGFNVTTRSDGWKQNRVARVKDIEVSITDGDRDLAYDISYNIRLKEPTLGDDTYVLSDLALA